MRTDDFDYQLPPELIAQHPPAERDAARMLVLDRSNGLVDRSVRDLPEYLEAGDVLVLNDSRVLPARLIGRRRDGGEAEVLLLRPLPEGHSRWEALIRPARRLDLGSRVTFDNSALAVAIEARGGETATVRLDGVADPLSEVRRIGEMPTPPYIKERLVDRERYQTVYARSSGSVAAPTAGLHFTPAVLRRLERRGVEVHELTLHVGPGTFRSIQAARIEDHALPPERVSIPTSVADAVNRARAEARRVIAVGTTTTRALESAAEADGHVAPCEGEAGLYIAPGHRFRVVDALLTNFHLPRSSLLVLAAAFAGRELILKSYGHAVRAGYRFYSYGDATLIL